MRKKTCICCSQVQFALGSLRRKWAAAATGGTRTPVVFLPLHRWKHMSLPAPPTQQNLRRRNLSASRVWGTRHFKTREEPLDCNAPAKGWSSPREGMGKIGNREWALNWDYRNTKQKLNKEEYGVNVTPKTERGTFSSLAPLPED